MYAYEIESGLLCYLAWVAKDIGATIWEYLTGQLDRQRYFNGTLLIMRR